MPSLSVVVCTRDRGARVLGTVRSILAGDCADLELIVIDQSDAAMTAEALAVLQADPHVRYVHTDTRGLSVARNLGLKLARGPLVALTDDDCAVDPSWATEIRRAFARDPRIALVFGNVVPRPFDPAQGFIPGYQRDAPFLAVGVRQKLEVEGMGACMALRRDAVLDLGGFDEMLGAGGPLRAGEDVDLTLRALASGHSVYETPSVRVVHDGFHAWTDGCVLVQAYWFGAGAAIGKHLQLRRLPTLGLLMRLAVRFVFGRSRVARSLGARATAWSRLTAFIKGLGAGASLPVDRTLGHFRST